MGCGSWTLLTHWPISTEITLTTARSTLPTLFCFQCSSFAWCCLQNAFRIDLQMWADNKGWFTWCVHSNWVSFFTAVSCLKCDSLPIPHKAPFPWDLNRTLGFILSVKFMFCLSPCFYLKSGDIWLFKKCLSRRDTGFKLCGAKGELFFPSYFACLMVKTWVSFGKFQGLWWWEEDMYSFILLWTQNVRNSVSSCWVLNLSGEVRTEMKGRGGNEKLSCSKCLGVPLRDAFLCSSASLPYPSLICFLPQGLPARTALMGSGNF